MGPGSVSSSDEAGWRPFVEGLLQAQRHHELETEIIDLFRAAHLRAASPKGRKRTPNGYRLDSVRELRSRAVATRATGPRFYDVVPLNARTRFVFLDYCCVAELGGALNATALTLRGTKPRISPAT